MAADATGTLANTATVTPPLGVTDPVLGNNTVTDTNAVLPLPVFGPPSGRKTVQVGAFADLEWRVVWLNNGNAVALRARLLDPMPSRHDLCGRQCDVCATWAVDGGPV